MKNIKYLSLFLLGLLVAACGDPDLNFESFDNTDQGAFARNLSLTGSFALADIAASSLEGRVEFYDENDGKNVASYNWTVEYRVGGTVVGSPVSVLAIPSSEFATNSDGLPEVSFSLRMQAAMDALGLTAADLTVGDQFRFEATITKTDGTSYNSTTAGPNIISQPTFSALFRITQSID